MDKYQELIFRKQPKYIFIFTTLIFFIIGILIFISCFYKYNKYYFLTGLQIIEGGNSYVDVLVPYDEMDNIKNYDLVVNKEKLDFTYEINNSYYNDSNKLYKEIKILVELDYEDGVLVELVFESPKTTVLKEIKNKIKKGMI